MVDVVAMGVEVFLLTVYLVISVRTVRVRFVVSVLTGVAVGVFAVRVRVLLKMDQVTCSIVVLGCIGVVVEEATNTLIVEISTVRHVVLVLISGISLDNGVSGSLRLIVRYLLMVAAHEKHGLRVSREAVKMVRRTSIAV